MHKKPRNVTWCHTWGLFFVQTLLYLVMEIAMKNKSLFSIILLAAPMLFAAYKGHKIGMDHADGYYRTGETAICRVTLCQDGKPLVGTKARMIMRWESKTIEQKEFTTTGKPVEFSYKSDKPGWIYFGFEVMDANGKTLRGAGVQKHQAKPTIVTEAGALFGADEIRTGIKRPEDFEKFWVDCRAKLDKVPIKPIYKPLDAPPGIKFFTVEIPCYGDFPVSGYLAIPENANPKSLQAYVDWCSWMASDTDPNFAIKRAMQGAIGFTPTWHGRPCNMGKDYYNYSTTIRINGGVVGIEDKETWCFTGMYYRVMRSLDFVKSLPEWDGKTLVSVGGSLGGAQSVAAAALDKDVTTAVIDVPCFCEFDGFASGRKCSTPIYRIPNIEARIAAGDRRPLDTCAYFDCVNLAPMIKCEVFVCTGFTDELCPPSNVYAFYNAIPATTKKTICTSPFTGHYGTTSNPAAMQRLKELYGAVRVFNYDVKFISADVIPGGFYFNPRMMDGIEPPTIYSYECPERFSGALRRKGRQNSVATLKMTLKETPERMSFFAIEGQDDDKPGTSAIRVTVNGKEIYSGPCAFPERNWGRMGFNIPAGFLVKGENLIDIANITPDSPSRSARFNDPKEAAEDPQWGWIALSEAYWLDPNNDFKKYINGNFISPWCFCDGWHNSPASTGIADGKAIITEGEKGPAYATSHVFPRLAITPGSKVRVSAKASGSGTLRLGLWCYRPYKNPSKAKIAVAGYASDGVPLLPSGNSGKFPLSSETKEFSCVLTPPNGTGLIIPRVFTDKGSRAEVTDFQMELILPEPAK